MSAGEAMPDTQHSRLEDREPPTERAGSPRLAQLARDHYRALVRFLRARTGSNEEAAEVAQEAFARMLSLDRPEAVGFLEGYLWKIAGNLAIDRSRQRATQARLSHLGHFEPEQSLPSPESHFYTQQRLELLEAAIGNLRHRPREAFILRVIEELSFKEVAARMNVTVEGAKFLVAQALEYCQTYLDAAEALRQVTK